MGAYVIVFITLEIILFAFIVYGFLHEDRLIAFEDRVAAAMKKRRAQRKEQSVAEYLAKRGLTVIPIDKTE